MVHRHPGLGISQAGNPRFLPSIQSNCPFPRSMQKMSNHSIAKVRPSEMLLSAFFPAAIIRSLPFQSMHNGVYVCVNMAIQVHVLPKAFPIGFSCK